MSKKNETVLGALMMVAMLLIGVLVLAVMILAKPYVEQRIESRNQHIDKALQEADFANRAEHDRAEREYQSRKESLISELDKEDAERAD